MLKKLLVLLTVLLITLALALGVRSAYVEYSNDYDNAPNFIIYEIDEYEIEGYLRSYYLVHVDDEQFAASTIRYSDEYGEGIYLVLEKRDKHFLAHTVMMVYGSVNNPIYEGILVIGHA